MYRSYAHAVGFHIDPCPPRSPEYKGKVERRIRDRRAILDPRRRAWKDLDELQRCSDDRVAQSHRIRTCPMTGSTVAEAWELEKASLAALPVLPEPFDVAVTRDVHVDCLVAFEGRQYTVPFQYVGRPVEVRGCANTVQILSDGRVLREYPRHTEQRVLIDRTCYEGDATDEILPPVPLGKMGRKLVEIAEMSPEKRPVDLYAALAEVAR